MDTEAVRDEVMRLSPSGGLVEITGGEPMLQERELVPLMRQLLESGYRVLLETSGERPLERVPPGVIKIVDVKCPHSGEAYTFHPENLEALTAHDEVKFVLSGRADYEFARDFIASASAGRARDTRSCSRRLFARTPPERATARTVCWIPQELAEWMLADNVPARLGLQLHKFIWDPAVKGV